MQIYAFPSENPPSADAWELVWQGDPTAYVSTGVPSPSQTVVNTNLAAANPRDLYVYLTRPPPVAGGAVWVYFGRDGVLLQSPSEFPAANAPYSP